MIKSAASVVLALFVAGCATPPAKPVPAGGSPPLKKVENVREIPGLADRLRAMLGQHYVLEHLPAGCRTVEEAYEFLLGPNSKSLLHDELARNPTNFGGQLEVEAEGSKKIFTFFAASAQFTGALVYAVTESTGHHRGVFISTGR